MRLGLEYLEGCAAETGYQVLTLEKVAQLGELAADISRDAFLRAALALKGGSALNFCFGPPSRLSVDLDFNYIGHIEREKMLADRPLVEKATDQLAQRHGYMVQHSADLFAGHKMYLTYPSVLGQRERIEVDLNFLFRLPISGTDTRQMWQPGELDQPQVRVVGLGELITGKLLALLDRGAPRDAWDVGRLPSRAEGELSSPLFRAKFIALSATLEHPLPSYTVEGLAKHIADQGAEHQLSPLLAHDQAPQPHVLTERAWNVLRPFLSLRPEEKEYVEALDRGELRLEILLPDDREEAFRLSLHPALQCKAMNVRDLLAKRRTPGRPRTSGDPRGT